MPEGRSFTLKQPFATLPPWLKYSVVVLVLLGTFLRFYNLDHKAYWVDETHTSLRMSGHTRQELVNELYTGEVITVERLQQYQRPSSDKGWDDTLNALKGNAEHAPLYFLMARLWVELFGYSVAIMRSLPALISLLLFPAIYWFCWELFRSPAVCAIALGLVAISPLHVLYAQEARPYSLWSVLIVTSSAALLWALRSNQPKRWPKRWLVYGITLSLGFYTQLLFAIVAAIHGLYVLLAEVVLNKWRFSRRAIAYLVTTLAAILSFLPWLIIALTNWEQIEESTASLTEKQEWGDLIDQWFFNLSRVFLDRELGSGNTLLALLAIAALGYVCWKAPWRSWLLLLLLTTLPFLALAVPDLLLDGQRSMRIRYLFPSYLGLQVAFAYWFGSQAVWAKTWAQKVLRILLVFLVVGGVIANLVSSQAQVWWTKSNPRSGYYPVVSSIINSADNPLIVSNGLPPDLLGLSYWLRPDIKLQLVTEPTQLKVAEGYRPIYLLNPTRRMRRTLMQQGYRLLVIYADYTDATEVEYRLWLVKPPLPRS